MQSMPGLMKDMTGGLGLIRSRQVTLSTQPTYRLPVLADSASRGSRPTDIQHVFLPVFKFKV